MRKQRQGISLIEVMVGIAITAAVLLIMIQFFQQMSKEIAKGRAIIEMATQGRSIGELLRNDLGQATVPPNAWTVSATPNGYFELIEGTANDSSAARNVAPYDTTGTITGDDYLGDFDDVLALTARNKDRPFRGRFRPFGGGQFANTDTVIESEISEIVWWSTFRDRDVNGLLGHDDQLSLYRRSLLIRPDLNNNPGFQAVRLTAAQIPIFYHYNDISVRWVSAGGGQFRPIANRLQDLAIRANRFGRYGTAFPNELTNARLNQLVIPGNNSTAAPHPGILANAQGIDLVLANLAAFDVRVYSPNAEVATVDNQLIRPGDPGYVPGGSMPGAGLEGAYVDLGYLSAAVGSSPIWFAENPVTRGTYGWSGTNRVWCSWYPKYESDGIDQNGDGNIDEGTDWLDTNGNGVVDDQDERETLPPYPYPIRGIQVTLRMIEKNTGQLRQMQIESSFVPE